ncbi:MAG: hypothetical protein AAF790_13095 [Planctomycetota bacterium]
MQKHQALLAACAAVTSLSLVAACPSGAHAQQATPWAPPAAQQPSTQAAPAAPSPATPYPAPGMPAAPEADGDGWLMRSPFFNVGWPEIKMPKLAWKPMWGPSEDGQPGFLATRVAKVKGAVAGAAQRTRLAWNKTVDRFKLSGGQPRAGGSGAGEPGFFARLFTPEPPRGPLTTTEFLAQERPGAQRR